ncbi:MAG TPA: hypothetical protein VGD00_03875 [Solirubrobacteraceae bacterium]
MRGKEPERRSGGLAEDARAMRVTLGALHSELARVNGLAAGVDLRAIVRDLLEGEVEAPTADAAELVRAGVEPDEFYEKDLQPSWEGLGESQRAARVEGFIELSQMMDAPGAAAGLPPDMIPRVHTKTLLLAWAFDETYGYLSALGRGEV